MRHKAESRNATGSLESSGDVPNLDSALWQEIEKPMALKVDNQIAASPERNVPDQALRLETAYHSLLAGYW